MTPLSSAGCPRPCSPPLPLTACGHAAGAAPEPSPQPVAGDAATRSAARVRADSARHPYTEADVRFMSDMIGHHAQALVMAGWAPTHGANPSVRRLAERIINAQQDEIATMQQLARRPRPAGAGSPRPG